MTAPLRVQLGPTSGTDAWKKASVDATILVSIYGLEVPYDFKMPVVQYLPDTMSKYPRAHDRYYVDGGQHWPFRGIF